MNPPNHSVSAEDYLYLVWHAARAIKPNNRYPTYGLDREDLVQEGVIGLMSALARFDPARGNRFATFAYHRIHGAMLDALERAKKEVEIRTSYADTVAHASEQHIDDLDRQLDRRLKLSLVGHVGKSMGSLEQSVIAAVASGETIQDQAAELDLPYWQCRRRRLGLLAQLRSELVGREVAHG